MDQIIYAMGGGPMGDPRMASHYPRIVELARERSGVEIPEIAIVPTAHFNGMHPGIGRGHMDLLAAKLVELGCVVRWIWMGRVPPGTREHSREEVREILASVDAVFVLGGDTRYLLEVVRERELVPLFEEAIARGVVMAGSSAGFIWLTRYCMSDAESFHKSEWSYVMLEGLGVLPVAGNAHDDGAIPQGLVPQVSRRKQFEERFKELGDVLGLAIDEFAAVEVRNLMCTVRAEEAGRGAYLLRNVGGSVERETMTDGVRLDLR